MRKKLTVWLLALALCLPLAAPALAADTTYNYAVEGGNLKFNPTTGTIVDCSPNVYSADIPSKIYDVPVTTIGKYAFESCTKLASVTIPSSVTTIENGAFRYCRALKSIVIPSSVTKLGNETGVFSTCTALESVTIPGSLKRLSFAAFYGCTNLKTVTIGYGVEEIGKSAFNGCKSLESITLPDSVKSIEQYAFQSCENLTTATIGSGVKNIDNSAFTYTKKLESLYFRGNAPSATSKMITHFADGFKVYYPDTATGWTAPTWNGYITKSYSLTPKPDPSLVTAVPTASTVYVNGTQVAFDAYNIAGNNYFKLRDLAFILSGSEAQFEVGWNAAANSIQLTTRKPYTPVGGEMSAGSKINQIGKPTKSALYLNGARADFTAYNINGNNYFKLRDIGQAINFSVEWDAARRCITIDTSLPYRPE